MHKSAFAIQNQRHVWNEAVYRAKVTPECLYKVVYGLSIDDKSGDLGWTLAYFSGKQNFSTTDISYTFGRSNVGDLANRNLFPEFRELWSGGSCDTMQRHASFLHWYGCIVVFSTTFLCLPIVLECKLSEQVSSIAGWFPATARLSCIKCFGVSIQRWCVSIGLVVLTQHQCVTDGRTDRQTDRRRDRNATSV